MKRKVQSGRSIKSSLKSIKESYSSQNKGFNEVVEKIDAEKLEYTKAAWHDNRPYQKSTLFIQNIIDSGLPGIDPRGSAGLWWKVEGGFNGSQGMYELLISPDKTKIWHFLFKR